MMSQKFPVLEISLTDSNYLNDISIIDDDNENH